MSDIEVDAYPVKEGLDGLTVEVHHGLASLSSALRATLISPNECDQNLEPANAVDGLFAIARSINSLAKAVTALAPEGRRQSNDGN